ncbi:hypothetical protein HMPREF0262_02556 [Clostridium sp. ATCC 29733]|nr:hypothetical protein HMPREF0262_02556 [Clostridium sp. ATCC 29733]
MVKIHFFCGGREKTSPPPCAGGRAKREGAGAVYPRPAPSRPPVFHVPGAL